MKTAAAATVSTLFVATAAPAAVAGASQGTGVSVALFLAFGAVIVLAQLLPALTLLASMVAGLFAGGRTAAADVADHAAGAR